MTGDTKTPEVKWKRKLWGGGRDRGKVGVAGVGIAADGESEQESGGRRRRPSVQWEKNGFVRGVIPGQLRNFARRNLHQSEDSVRGRGRFR